MQTRGEKIKPPHDTMVDIVIRLWAIQSSVPGPVLMILLLSSTHSDWSRNTWNV